MDVSGPAARGTLITQAGKKGGWGDVPEWAGKDRI